MNEIYATNKQVGYPDEKQIMTANQVPRIPHKSKYGEGDYNTEYLSETMKKKIAVAA
jgi:hypothetical protein